LMVLRRYPSPRGFTVIPIHWSMDEAKASDPQWEINERKKYGREEDWARELEIDFGSHLGALAYPHFKRAVHVVDDLQYFDRMPLVLFCDFNQSPLGWGVGQIIAGWVNVLDEIFREPSTIEGAVGQFREMYPAHKGELQIFGDATTKSFYDTMRLALRGYSAPVRMRVPQGNPRVKDRVNAVDTKLWAQDGKPGIRVAKRCKELIEDFEGVMWRPNEKDLLKSTDQRDPYSRRTHISDAMGYWIAQEFPVSAEKPAGLKPVPRAPLRPGKVLGDVVYRGHTRGER